MHNKPGFSFYYWIFGNGDISTIENPASLTYNDAGIYILQYLAVQTDTVYCLSIIEVVSGLCSDGAITGVPDFCCILKEVDINNQIT